jgi:hypothetical protein
MQVGPVLLSPVVWSVVDVLPFFYAENNAAFLRKGDWYTLTSE